MTEQTPVRTFRVPLDRADNPDGQALNRGTDHIDVPVVIDPSLTRHGELGYAYDYSRVIRLREWNEQVLLHELLHVALSRIPQIWADDEHHHNIVSRIEVALWETGWRLSENPSSPE